MVERFSASSSMWSIDGVPLKPETGGAFVRYSDYAALEAQLAERVRVAPMVTEWREITEDDQPPRDVPVLMGCWESWPRDEWVVEFGLYGSTKGGWIHGRMTHWLPASILPIAPALTAAQEPPAPKVTATHRHKKRGTEYVLLGIGKMQCNWWEILGAQNRYPVDMREVAIYRSIDDGSLWVRPREEFEDGRFEALTAEQEPASMVTEAKVDAALAAFEYAGRCAYTRARIKAALKAAMEAGR